MSWLKAIGGGVVGGMIVGAGVKKEIRKLSGTDIKNSKDLKKGQAFKGFYHDVSNKCK